MDPEEDFNRLRLRTRVQVVAVIDILVGTIPFITLAFDFNDKDLADEYEDREKLVLLWTVLLCVYVLQLIMGVWLLAATAAPKENREIQDNYIIGNCQVWYYVAMFTFVFYTGEMALAISSILAPTSHRSLKQIVATLVYHAAKIIYRFYTLMIVNNFLYDICRPVYRYLSQGNYQYKNYYHTKLGIPLQPPRRRSLAATFAVQNSNPSHTFYSTYPQPQSQRSILRNPYRGPMLPHPSNAPPRPYLQSNIPSVVRSRVPYHHYPLPPPLNYANCNSSNLNRKLIYNTTPRPQ